MYQLEVEGAIIYIFTKNQEDVPGNFENDMIFYIKFTKDTELLYKVSSKSW